MFFNKKIIILFQTFGVGSLSIPTFLLPSWINSIKRLELVPHTIAASIEAEAFLAAHSDLVGVDLLLPDQHGVL